MSKKLSLLKIPKPPKLYFYFTYQDQDQEKTLFVLESTVDDAFSKAIKHLNLKGIELTQANLRLINNFTLEQ